MKRKFEKILENWKNNSKLPLMVVGVRQIGKTYIVDKFCKENYINYIYINLENEEKIYNVFEQTLKPDEISKQIKLILNVDIDENTVIFFDEIQCSERAITSLKYFAESDFKYNIICAGSLLGVKINRFKSSFPVR
ncbi:MAG: AAA family ATPase [Clostridia bacterium]